MISKRAIKAFINEHAGLFGHTAELLDDAELKSESVNPRNGLRTVIWQQQVDGIPIFQGLFIGHLTQREELVSIESHFIPRPKVAAEATNPDRVALALSPPISAMEAVARAANNIHSPASENKTTMGASPTLLNARNVLPINDP